MKSAFACIVEHFTNTSRLTLKSTAEFRNGIRPPTISSDNNGEKKMVEVLVGFCLQFLIAVEIHRGVGVVGAGRRGIVRAAMANSSSSSMTELGSQPSPPFFKIIISIFLKRLSLTA